MIALYGIAKQYGGRYLFRDLSLTIGDHERVALVGPNGAGKSTLMKIVMGLVEPDEGRMVQSRSNTVGYLPQDGIVHGGRTIYDEAALAFDDILMLHERTTILAAEIERLNEVGKSGSPEQIGLVDELGKIQHHLEHRQGYHLEERIASVLSGLGFREPDFERRTDELSGGWQMRLALAKLLLREPTILILDEPTNHLDIESLQWLESYLQAYEGSVVLISHDMRFLDAVVRRTLEVSTGKLTEYAGNYSWYLEEKARRVEVLRAAKANQDRRIEQSMRFVERFRSKATKARQVQSRLKLLDRVERIELDDEAGSINFDFPRPPAPGRVLMKLEGIEKRYGDLQVLHDLSLLIERGDRIAFLGINGAGKSTLARIIAGIESFQAGRREPGHNLRIAYYAQQQAEELDPAKTVLATLEDAASLEVRPRLRTLLGCFLFSGDDVFKPVAVLSGGEKSRLALARMLLEPANLLVLDEPTNHLDLRSKAVLQQALDGFEGSLIIVSHDREFLAPLVNKVAEFREGKVSLFLGTVDGYLERVRREREEARTAARSPRKSEDPGRDGGGEKQRKRLEAEERQRRYREIKPLREELAEVERKLAAAEARKAEVEAALSSENAYRDAEKAKSLAYRYREVTTDLAHLYDRWMRIEEEIGRLGEGDGPD